MLLLGEARGEEMLNFGEEEEAASLKLTQCLTLGVVLAGCRSSWSPLALLTSAGTG